MSHTEQVYVLLLKICTYILHISASHFVERPGSSCSPHVPKTLLHISMLHKRKQIRIIRPKDQRIFILFFALGLSTSVESHCASVGERLDCEVPLATAAFISSRASGVSSMGRVI